MPGTRDLARGLADASGHLSLTGTEDDRRPARMAGPADHLLPVVAVGARAHHYRECPLHLSPRAALAPLPTDDDRVRAVVPGWPP